MSYEKGELLSWQKEKAEFLHDFAPQLEKDTACRGFGGGEKEGDKWSFSGYDENAGTVTIVRRPPEENNAYYEKEEISLLEFYMLNEGHAPEEMKVLLSQFVETWDARSCKPFRIGTGSDLEDAAYDFLKDNEKTEKALLSTPVSVGEGKELVRGMYKAVIEESGRNEDVYLSDLDDERRARAEQSRKRREMLFGRDIAAAPEELRQAA